MEYISAEEFLKQPKEVQEVFIDWWKPSAGDLIGVQKDCIDSNWKNKIIYKIIAINEEDIFNSSSKGELLEDLKSTYKTDELIPSLTEGQLRKFIEDKTGYKIVYNYNYEGNIIVGLKDIKSYGFIKEYETDEADLLQAYWKVACEIAKEQIQQPIRKGDIR